MNQFYGRYVEIVEVLVDITGNSNQLSANTKKEMIRNNMWTFSQNINIVAGKCQPLLYCRHFAYM